MATFLAHIRVLPGREQDFEQIAAELHPARTSTSPTSATSTGGRPSRRATTRWRPSTASTASWSTRRVTTTSSRHQRCGDVIETMHLEWLDPVPGASDAAVTDVGPLPDGASDWPRATTSASPATWWPTGGPPARPLSRRS